MQERQSYVMVAVVIGIILSAGILYQVVGIPSTVKELSDEIADLTATEENLVRAIEGLTVAEQDLAKAFAEEMEAVSEQISAIEERLRSVEEALVIEPIEEVEQVLILAHQRFGTSFLPYRVGGSGFYILIPSDTYFTYNKQGELITHIVESYDISADGLVQTWNLKNYVKFHCGDPVNAEAVKYTFEYAMTPENPSYGVFKDIDRVEVVDEYTVKIYFNAFDALFMENMAVTLSGTPICPRHSEEYGDDYGITYWCGTGPFKLVEHVYEDHTTFVKNEEYNWGPSWHTGPPLLDKIIIKWIPDATVITVGLISGDLDAAIDISTIQYETLVSAPNLDVTLEDILSSYFMTFNTEKQPWDDIRMRTAVAHAIDRESIAESFRGTALITHLPMPEKLGLEPKPELIPEYDVDKANSILDDLGWVMADDGFRYKDGVLLKANQALYRRSVPSTGVTTMIQAMLAEIGIKGEIISCDWPELVDLTQRGEHDILAQGMTFASLASAEQMWHSDSILNAYNFAHINSTEIDELIEKGPTIVDYDERMANYQKLSDKIVSEVIYIPLYGKSMLGCSNKKVKNFNVFDCNTRTPVVPLLDCYIESD